MWTDSNVVQLFCLLAERDFLLTKFVWVVSACIKIAAESFLKFTQVFRMLKLSKNYQVKVEIADSKRKCHKSWVHICLWMIFFHISCRWDSQKYLEENAFSLSVQFSWRKNLPSFPLILPSRLGSFSGEILKVFRFKTPKTEQSVTLILLEKLHLCSCFWRSKCSPRFFQTKSF